MDSDLILSRDASTTAAVDPALGGLAATIITAILNAVIPNLPNLFANCFGNKKPSTPDEVRDHITAAYDESTDTYTNGATNPVQHDIRVKARRQGNPVTIRQARALAHHALDAIRRGDDGSLMQALSLHAAQNDDTDDWTPTHHSV